jgi:hypothetical protein
MRLLNTETLTFKVFFDEEIPPYAILSHRWREDEVSYQDFLAHRKRDGAGFAKIVRACELAATEENWYGVATRAKLAWVWVDTCCV